MKLLIMSFSFGVFVGFKFQTVFFVKIKKVTREGRARTTTMSSSSTNNNINKLPDSWKKQELYPLDLVKIRSAINEDTTTTKTNKKNFDSLGSQLHILQSHFLVVTFQEEQTPTKPKRWVKKLRRSKRIVFLYSLFHHFFY